MLRRSPDFFVVLSAGLLGFAVSWNIARSQETKPMQDTPSLMASATIAILKDRSVSLAEKNDWKAVPEFFEECADLRKGCSVWSDAQFQCAQSRLIASWPLRGIMKAQVWEDTNEKDRQLPTDLLRDGWVPVGTMTFRADDKHVIFRRVAKSGEEFKIHTRNKTTPFLITVPDEDVAAIMALPALVSSSRKTLLEHKPARSDAKIGTSDANVVLFKASDSEQSLPAGISGLLLREIVRQGLYFGGKRRNGTVNPRWRIA